MRNYVIHVARLWKRGSREGETEQTARDGASSVEGETIGQDMGCESTMLTLYLRLCSVHRCPSPKACGVSSEL